MLDESSILILFKFVWILLLQPTLSLFGGRAGNTFNSDGGDDVILWTQKTKAEMIVEENQKRRQAEESKKEERRWATLSITIEQKIKEDMTYGMKDLQEFLRNCQIASVKYTAEMTALNICFGMWVECCDKGREKNNVTIAWECVSLLLDTLLLYTLTGSRCDSGPVCKYIIMV